jgi:hypothetical protein
VWGKLESLADYVERIKHLPTTPREHALSLVVQNQTLFISSSSEYSTTAGEHYGLEEEAYGRFSAPMREAVGVISHATLHALIVLEKLAPGMAVADKTLVWEHLLLGALVDPKVLDVGRKALVADVQALEQVAPADVPAQLDALLPRLRASAPSAAEKALVDDVINRTISSGNNSRVQQKQVDTSSLRLLFDDLFLQDLGGVNDPKHVAPLRKGIITAVQPSKVYVQLDDPDIEVRLAISDLKKDPTDRFFLERDGCELRQKGGGLSLVIGKPVQVQATYHDGERLHFRVVEET